MPLLRLWSYTVPESENNTVNHANNNGTFTACVKFISGLQDDLHKLFRYMSTNICFVPTYTTVCMCVLGMHESLMFMQMTYFYANDLFWCIYVCSCYANCGQTKYPTVGRSVPVGSRECQDHKLVTEFDY